MMVAQLMVVAALVLAAYWIGWYVGRGGGYAEAMRWRQRVDRMGELLETARFDEPGSPRLN